MNDTGKKRLTLVAITCVFECVDGTFNGGAMFKELIKESPREMPRYSCRFLFN